MNATVVILDVGLLNGLLLVPVVVALAVAFRLLHFPDVTVEGSFPLGAAVYAAATTAGWPLPVAVIAAVISGSAAGAVTAVLYAWFRLNRFLAGILVVSALYSVMLHVMGGPNVGLLSHPSPLDAARRWAVVGRVHLGLLGILSVALAGIGAATVWALSTRPGTRLRAVGSNPTYARSIRLNPIVYLVVGLAGTNALAAAAGVAAAMNQGFADVGLGQGVLVLSLAAMTLGEAVVPRRVFASHAMFVVVSGAIGSLLFECVTVSALRAGVPAIDLKLVTAAAVLVLVAARLTTDRSVVDDREFA